MLDPYTLPLIVALAINAMAPDYRDMPTEFRDSVMSVSRHGTVTYTRSEDCRTGARVLQHNIDEGASAARQAKDIWTLYAANCDPGYHFGNYSKAGVENFCIELRIEYAFRKSLELSPSQVSLNQATFYWLKCDKYNQD